jgi:hypothetical protein
LDTYSRGHPNPPSGTNSYGCVGRPYSTGTAVGPARPHGSRRRHLTLPCLLHHRRAGARARPRWLGWSSCSSVPHPARALPHRCRRTWRGQSCHAGAPAQPSLATPSSGPQLNLYGRRHPSPNRRIPASNRHQKPMPTSSSLLRRPVAPQSRPELCPLSTTAPRTPPPLPAHGARLA